MADDAQTNSAPDQSLHPLYGVKGWLQFFVVVNRFVRPFTTLISVLLASADASEIARQGHILFSTFLYSSLLVDEFLALQWFLIAGKLARIEAGAVQTTRRWLAITLGVHLFYSTLMPYIALLDWGTLPIDLTLEKNIFFGLAAIVQFVVWYSYFNFSRRVRATYPDWNA